MLEHIGSCLMFPFLYGLVSAFVTYQPTRDGFYLWPSNFAEGLIPITPRFARHRNIAWTPQCTLRKQTKSFKSRLLTNSGKVGNAFGLSYRRVLRYTTTKTDIVVHVVRFVVVAVRRPHEVIEAAPRAATNDAKNWQHSSQPRRITLL